MSQLGYTWYPQDWWTSETFKRLKRFPLVRYAIRELFDLMYKEGKPVKMNREYLIDDFNIELSDQEYKKLLEFVIIDSDGNWWMSSIRKRISKAEAARENGKLGGRPKNVEKIDDLKEEKTQKPNFKTEEKNPENPPLERERERESKIEINNIDFSSLLSFINKSTGRNFQTINDSVKKKFKARLRDGYTKEGIRSAIKNAVNNEYHQGNQFQYLTPEFFSRADTIDKYSTISKIGRNRNDKPQKDKPVGVWSV